MFCSKRSITFGSSFFQERGLDLSPFFFRDVHPVIISMEATSGEVTVGLEPHHQRRVQWRVPM